MFENYIPFWDKLTDKQKILLSDSIKVKAFLKGDMLHDGSNRCDGFIVVTSGQLRAFTVSEEGKELTMYRLFPHDMCLFSASCIMNNIEFDVMVQGEENGKLIIIPSDVYKELMEQSIHVANYTNQLMASRFSDVMWLIDQIINKKMDQRIGALIYEEFKLNDSKKVQMTHEELANHLGTAREVVTRILKVLQQDGIIVLSRGTIEVKDENKLYKIAADSLR